MGRFNKRVPQNPQRSISKLKSSIRQAKRFMLKEGLNALVVQNTERKLKALESELQLAERAKVERAMASKYHMVKFFERQKLTRKVNRAKRDLANTTSNLEKRQLEKELFSLRVDLNYILNYPKTKKYISIVKPAEGDAKEKRREIRKWVKDCMKRGEMDAEPELYKEEQGPKGKEPRWEGEMDVVEEDADEEEAGGVVVDEFFETAEVTPDETMEEGGGAAEEDGEGQVDVDGDAEDLDEMHESDDDTAESEVEAPPPPPSKRSHRTR